MRTSSRWARRVLAAALLVLPPISGCGLSPPGIAAIADQHLTVVPELVSSYQAQTVFAPYTRASIHHLVLKLFRLEGPPEAPTEQPVLDAAGQPVTLDVPAARLGLPVSFSRLKGNTRYRVRAEAYSGPGVSEGERISTLDAQSAVDVTVGLDDAPVVVQLRVRLRDRNVYGGPVGAPTGSPDGASALPSDAGLPMSAHNPVQDEYFVVWRDDRHGHRGIMGRRVSRAGVALGSDVRLSGASFEADAPAVAFNPTTQEYLVVWHEDRGGATGHDIVGQRVGNDGASRGAPFVIGSEGLEQYQPRLAFNAAAQEFLVVWNEVRPGTQLDIMGRRVAADGALRGTETVLSASTQSQAQPTVAFNSVAAEYLVVWDEWRGTATGSDIMARRVSAAGAPLGSDLVVSEAAAPQLQPSVAFNPAAQRYLVTWGELRTSWDVVGRQLSASGAGVGSEITVAGSANMQFQPTVAFNPATPDFLVVYNEFRTSSGWDIVSRRVGTNGSVGSDLVVASTPGYQFQPAVAGHASNGQALVAWQGATAQGGDLFTSVVGTATTTPQALGSPMRAYVDQRSARVTANTVDGGHMLTWLDVDKGAPVVRGQLVDHRGVAVSAPFIVTNSAGAKAHLTAAFNPTAREYLLVWQEYRGDAGWDIMARRVNANGLMLLGPEFVVSSTVYAQEQPAVAFSVHAQEFLVVWQESLGNRVANLAARRVRADGVLAGTDFPIIAGNNPQEQAAVAYHAGARQFLVVWSERRATTGWDVAGRRVLSGGGTTGSPFVIAGSANFAEQPDLAYNATAQEFLVVWQEHRAGTDYDVLGQRINGAGVFQGGELVLASAVAPQEQPVVTYNPAANEYLTAWQEQRSDTGWDILGQRFTGAVTPIGQPLTLAQAAMHQIEPRLAYQPLSNDWLLSWRDGRQSPTHTHFDVYVQAVDSFAGP